MQTSPYPSGRLVPTGYGTLGAVKRQIEHRPGVQGSISSGTRLGGCLYPLNFSDYGVATQKRLAVGNYGFVLLSALRLVLEKI